MKKENIIKKYYSFGDILLKPKFSNFKLDDIDISTNISKLQLKIPIIVSPMDTVCGHEMALMIGKLGGLGIIHRNQTIDSQVNEVKKVAKQDVLVGAAIGVSNDFKKRTRELVKAGAKLICVDYSIGQSKKAIETATYIKKKYKTEVMTGNIATKEAVLDYIDTNINIFRYGMGAGSMCISRKISGVGVPQLSAILDTKLIQPDIEKYIIADGGIKTSGDIVKALAAGADAVMLGSMLSGTDETPSKNIVINGEICKKYRGMGSICAMKQGSNNRYHQGLDKKLHAEGVEEYVVSKNKVEEIMNDIIYGIKTGMLKTGVKNIKELQKKAEFIEISTNAQK